MTKEQRHKRFNDTFTREDGVLDISKYDSDAIKSFIDKEVDMAVAEREKEIVKMIEKHKQKACVIADYPDYDETNMTRYIENPLMANIVYQHIDFIRELQSLIKFKT